MREWFPYIVFGWNVIWSVGTVLAAWWISRSRAEKGEISQLQKDVGERATVESVKALGERVDAKANRSQFESLEARVDAHERRVQKIESDSDHLPSRDQFHTLELSFARMAGAMDVISATLKTNVEITRRLEDYWLDQAGRK